MVRWNCHLVGKGLLHSVAEMCYNIPVLSILLPYASCSAAVLLAGAGLYCLCRAMLSRRRVFLHAFSGMRRGNVAVLLALAAVATIEAQKGGGGKSPAAGG